MLFVGGERTEQVYGASSSIYIFEFFIRRGIDPALVMKLD
jgi:hypothetical protein